MTIKEYNELQKAYYAYRDEIIRRREEIYDEMCRLLTDYENDNSVVTKQELYKMLVKIQNNWETVITVQND